MINKKKGSNRISDPGFGEKVGGRTQRLINKDGSFNVQSDTSRFAGHNIYQYLLEINIGTFILLAMGGFVLLSAAFAVVYYMVGPESLSGQRDARELHSFLDCFYFSTQTFTTVGYGAIAPQTPLASAIAALEAFIGLLFFAVATGLLYSRFSKPKSKLLFSNNAIIAPFNGGKALMFRLANMRRNTLMEMSARVILVMRNKEDTNRNFYNLELQLDKVVFLPLTWTLVHPITEESPFYNITPEELIERDGEIMILISGFDDTFNQTVHARYSYVAKELVWNARFVRAFQIDEQGKVVIKLNDIHNYELLPQETLDSAK
jgi:inward rectifier potassium channel